MCEKGLCPLLPVAAFGLHYSRMLLSMWFLTVTRHEDTIRSHARPPFKSASFFCLSEIKLQGVGKGEGPELAPFPGSSCASSFKGADGGNRDLISYS